MTYVAWALLGMAAYSTATLFFKLATRAGTFPALGVLGMAAMVVGTTTVANAFFNGGFAEKSLADFTKPSALFSYAAGLALAVAVCSLVKGLSLGPASVVVPIYGMFILGGTILGIAFLGESFSLRQSTGMLLAVAGVYLVAR